MARDTTFYLYKNVNLSPTTGDTFYFSNKTARDNYFDSKIFRTVSACSYQRENRQYCRVNLSYSLCYDIDYICFLNSSYENKRFYCFVTEVNYISDNVTEIVYAVDPIQTWLLDCTFTPCFIERMHTATDNIGDNILEEGLECGDYIIDSMYDGISTQSGRILDNLVIFQTTFNMLTWCSSNFTDKGVLPIRTRNGLIDSLGLYACYCTASGVQNEDSTSALGVILEKIFTGAGGVTLEDVVNIYVYPKVAIGLNSQTAVQPTGATTSVTLFQKVYEVSSVVQSLRPDTSDYYGAFSQLPGKPQTINGYTPKNNKLFTYPYCLLHITNNNGSAIDLKYERFLDPSNPEATIFGTTTAEAKIRLVPRNYCGSGNYDDIDTSYGIDSAPYPTVSLLGDSYNIWYAQNRNTIENNYNWAKNWQPMRDVANLIMGTGLSAGGTVNMVSGGYNVIEDTYKKVFENNSQIADRSIAPNTASGIQSEGLAFQNGKAPFTFIVKTIDSVHAKCIDDYFTMYGYPIRGIATPSFHNRTGFTFIKTVGCIAKGNVPETTKNEIQRALDAGIRFWVDPANIGNYSITNSVLT